MHATNEMEPVLTIGDLSEATGVSTHTLRYYEGLGLIPQVRRAGSGNHRRYARRHIGWIAFLRRLRDARMPLPELQEYVALLEKGEEESLPERMAILARHRERIVRDIEDLTELLEVLDRKLGHGCKP